MGLMKSNPIESARGQVPLVRYSEFDESLKFALTACKGYRVVIHSAGVGACEKRSSRCGARRHSSRTAAKCCGDSTREHMNNGVKDMKKYV